MSYYIQPRANQTASDPMQTISDIMVTHERVLSAFSNSMSSYYNNASTMGRMPGNNSVFEQNVASHIEMIRQHYALMYRIVEVIDNTIRPQRSSTYADATFSTQPSRFRQRAPRNTSTSSYTDISNNNVNQRVTDTLIQEMVSNLITPSRPPATSNVSLSEALNIFSLFSPRTERVFEFETTIPIGLSATIEPSINLTLAEVEEHTELVEYHEGDNAMNETRCPITYEDFTEGEEVRRIRYCRHYFKNAAILDWLRNTRGSCPVCRHNLLEDDTHTAE